MFSAKYSLVVWACVCFLPLVASEFPRQPRHKGSGNGNRLSIGTSINFYRINLNHAAAPRQKPNFMLGFRRELRMSNDYKTYLLFGADYYFHGLGFKSYYFEPGTIQVYDKNFAYDYTLFINEIQLPIQVKYMLRAEDNSIYSPYFMFGHHFRYMLPGILQVRDQGKLIKDEIADVKFKTALISKRVNSTVSASLGWQKNKLGPSKKSFFAEFNIQYGFSDYFFSTTYSANSLFINCTQVTFLVGFKL